jgi:hypothetical protein
VYVSQNAANEAFYDAGRPRESQAERISVTDPEGKRAHRASRRAVPGNFNGCRTQMTYRVASVAKQIQLFAGNALRNSRGDGNLK